MWHYRLYSRLEYSVSIISHITKYLKHAFQEYLLLIAKCMLAFEGFRTVQTVSLSTDCPPLNTVAANPHSQCGTSYFFFFSLVLTLVLCSNLCSEKRTLCMFKTSCITGTCINLFRRELNIISYICMMDAVFSSNERET